MGIRPNTIVKVEIIAIICIFKSFGNNNIVEDMNMKHPPRGGQKGKFLLVRKKRPQK